MLNSRSYISLLLLISATVLLSACGSTLKQNWRNFTAYYNTYYNAKRAYQTGIEQVEEQSVNINPEQPIRIHTAPVGAGQQNFQKAITKGAKILRKYPNTKWVDNALSLIGKSYYYRQEYFSAEQKFRELYANANSPKMKQRAVLWRGRIFMEMELYSQGISYLQNELGDIENWNKSVKAEVQSVMAELYSYLNQWEPANEYLVESIPQLNDNDHKARAYFLHGQVLERLDRLEESFGAYRQVPGLHPEYDIIYHARRKQAEVSREAGKLQRAYRIFVEMSKDDKNFEILPELKYEIARTLQAMGETDRALQKYKDVLYDSNHQPNNPTKAKTYYGLATLYQEHFKDFKMTAAYYDSAASVGVDKQKLPVDFDAERLSKSFGEYASLKEQINAADSLMRLGNLPKAKFDSVLAEIRKKREKRFEKMQENQRRNANTMVTGSEQYDPESSPSAAKTSGSGFLNYQNKKRVFEGRQQFEAYWGNRPLVDHWRRLEMIRELKQSSDTTISSSRKKEVASTGPTLQELNIDLKDIPFSEEARSKKKQEVFKAQYELANTFFLSLDMPDSARVYYHKILENAPDSASIVPQALYSLSELHFIENDSLEARKFADRIVERYTNTEYARRMADRFGYELPETDRRTNVSRADSMYTAYQTMNDSITKRHSLARARAYRNFEDRHETTKAGAYALYQSALEYAQAARIEASSDERYPREAFEGLFADGNGASKALASLNTASASVRSKSLTCSGSYWDSTQVVVKRLHENYSGMKISSGLRPASEKDSLFTCSDVRLSASMNSDMKRYAKQIEQSRPYDHALDTAGLAFVKLRERLLETFGNWEAERLRAFAMAHTSFKLAPTSLYRAAQQYMKVGRRDSVYHLRVDEWFREQQRYEEDQEQLQAQRDSVKAVMEEEGISRKQQKKNQTDRPAAEEGEGPQQQRPSESERPGEPSQPNRPNRGEPSEETADRRTNGGDRDNTTESDTTDQASEERIKELRNQLQTLQDSTARKPDYEEVFPYLGAPWDSARSVLNQFEQQFTTTQLDEDVEQLKQELTIPEELKQAMKPDSAATKDSLQQAPADSINTAPADSVRQVAADTSVAGESPQTQPDADRARRAPPSDSLREAKMDSAARAAGQPDRPPTLNDENTESDSIRVPPKPKKSKVYACEELDVSPKFDGNMKDFTDKIEFPDKFKEMTMRGEAEFDVWFSQQGKVDRAEPATMGTKEGFNEAIQEAIEKHITVDPVVHQGDTVRVKCNMKIPIILNPDQ